ncbi:MULTISPECIES: sialate O-acetylesterase [unclassified Pedobacter]|uniref:sialate O-acetylesterase n=1 Tax=unclassified Pedobacter TaxID=2628915 RepID=UPI001421E31F|nr:MULTISPECIES: sialate O-acetylesterase [unclassified Pedobacter]NII82273.1 sialate O-acetylesterase [Pedobacter sp. SG908]NMN36297.1 sialate O-acetylesterase [Pedobacter sp. SG918]
MSIHRLRSILLIVLLLFTSQFIQAKILLPSVFGNNMVLQQKTNAAIWGQADAGKAVKVTVSWNKINYGAIADANGNWKIKVATPGYGGPYTITISDGELLVLNNILIGDVWICSGQSNMEMPLAGWGKILNYEKEIAEAKFPDIRLLQVDHVTSNSPINDAKVANDGWQECSPKYIAGFSSTAYFFAREVYEKTKIPIGLIHTSWGGTIAEAWTSAESLKKMADFSAAVDKFQKSAKNPSTVSYEERLQNWTKMTMDKDSGNLDGQMKWALTESANWKNMTLPTLWEDAALKNLDGVVWFTKKITIPENWKINEAKLNLGTIDDNDITFINGVKVGETVGYNIGRTYTIPANLLKVGENVITVRVFDSGGGGGLYGDTKELNLTNGSSEKISLAGEWKYKIGLDFKNIEPKPFEENGPNRPTVLYNAMIHPYQQFSIKGAIWYQGEANADRAYQYRELFPTMIKDWRQKWAQGDFPFYYVQLANFMQVDNVPVESAWAELREAQQKTLALPNTGMATIIDIGDAKDIHPKNKQEVGRRLALIALAKTYGQKINYSGPVYQSNKIEGKQILLTFVNSQNGLKAADGAALTGFAIAGADKKFYWAKASIRGNQIIVSSDQVANPVAVRYAWGNNPVCNLVSNDGLPASPFRTDTWPGLTFGKK